MKKNKVLKIFIAIILLISIQTVSIAATTGIVNKDTVRVREKPSTAGDSEIIGLVSIGKKVTIIGEEDNWYKIKGTDDHGNNVEGYIRQDLLTVDGEVSEPKNEEETPTQPEEPNNNQSGETTNKGPDEKPNEEPNEKTDEKPNEGTGVAEQNDRAMSIMKVTNTLTVGQKIQLAENIKIKILPSANSSNIVELTANTEVTVLEVINKWCRIETGEHAGWVRIDQ